MEMEDIIGLPPSTLAAGIDVCAGEQQSSGGEESLQLLVITLNPQTLRPALKRDAFSVQFANVNSLIAVWAFIVFLGGGQLISGVVKRP